MKKMIFLALAFVATMGFVACGDDKDDNKKDSGSEENIHYTWTNDTIGVTIPTAEAFVDTIKLESLKSDAKVESYVRTWADLILLPTDLTNKVVTAILKLDANPTTDPRTTEFKLSDGSKNTVTLRITQVGKSEDKTEQPADTDLNHANDEESDQPAFSRR